MAYIANGGYGIFTDIEKRSKIAQHLADKGHVFRSRVPEVIGRYPVLGDGSCAHMSDVMCHLIEDYMAGGDAPGDAMARAYCEFASEIVGLMLHADHGDRIFATRINQPLMFGRGGGAMYMASAAMAFPDGVDWLAMMPSNAAAVVRPDCIEVAPFETPPGPVADPIPWHDAETRLLDALADGEWKPRSVLWEIAKAVWPEGQAKQDAMLLYEILRGLKSRGRIEMKDIAVPGVEEGETAPQRTVRLIPTEA